ncbi:lipocalin family protein [Phenylobacterium sp.]|jgi:apolipoprotein D and lipocalin family protein|uniref:lipocalin family protein n=1 Tax=Phenylobacterium sp. TaxID=1871053 RepID=UPI002E37A608|nr:lipocalin family protein [Phenylobacterium sp.]HEX3365849.1 lipocalin family protein [Phenylobacterium sp.]
MLKRLIVILAAAAALAAALPAAAASVAQPVAHIELARMMGRWYEVARLPNMTQRGCQAGTSDWTRSGEGFAVVQACHKGSPDGPVSEWKAKAHVADPVSNAKFKMSFFGGLVSQEYWVLEERSDEGWLILATHDGKYLWLMSQKPILPMAIKTEAVARIKQLGFDVGRLEFPLPAHG